MKYIKTFEKIKRSELKKYFVDLRRLENNRTVYVIFEILTDFYDQMTGNELSENAFNIQRKYWCEGNNIVTQKSIFRHQSIKKYKIVYTSDSIDDCLEYTELKLAANKYNIL